MSGQGSWPMNILKLTQKGLQSNEQLFGLYFMQPSHNIHSVLINVTSHNQNIRGTDKVTYHDQQIQDTLSQQ